MSVVRARIPAKSVVLSVRNTLSREDQEAVELELDGQRVKLTHLNKVYFPESGITKRQVLLYYATVGPFLLPFLQNRPLVLHRYPNGIAQKEFYQKEAGSSIPHWIQTANIYSETKRHDVAYFLINDMASLLYLTNLGCIEHNPFSARVDELEQPDYMFIDLDPTAGTAFSRVVRAATITGEILQKAKVKFFIKTSGATGLHMFIPIERRYSFGQVRAFLEIVARLAMDREKGLLTRTFRVQDRPKNTVFFDVRQNSAGQSLACVFSLRPHPGAPASTPLVWSELQPTLRPTKWNLHSVLGDIAKRSTIWKNFFEFRQTLEAAVAALETNI